MAVENNIVSLFGMNRKPSSECNDLYGMLREILGRVWHIEKVVTNDAYVGTHSKGRES